MIKSKLANGRSRVIGGWRKEPEDRRDYRLSTRTAVTLPSVVDVSAGCPRIEDQGAIGSCTANAGTDCVEFVMRKLGLEQPELSRLFVYFATRTWVAGWDPADDSGAYIRDTMKAMSVHGACREELWPYSRRFSDQPSQEACEEAETRQVTSYWRCDNLDAIRTCLAEGYVLEGGFVCPEGMFTYDCETTGVVPMPKNSDDVVGGHAVTFVGYDDGRRLLKFKNSWGQSWGDGGYGYLPYDYVLQGLADDFWTVRGIEVVAPEPVDPGDDPVDPEPPTPPDPVEPGPAPRQRCWLLRLIDWLMGR